MIIGLDKPRSAVASNIGQEFLLLKDWGRQEWFLAHLINLLVVVLLYIYAVDIFVSD